MIYFSKKKRYPFIFLLFVFDQDRWFFVFLEKNSHFSIYFVLFLFLLLNKIKLFIIAWVDMMFVDNFLVLTWIFENYFHYFSFKLNCFVLSILLDQIFDHFFLFCFHFFHLFVWRSNPGDYSHGQIIVDYDGGGGGDGWCGKMILILRKTK